MRSMHDIKAAMDIERTILRQLGRLDTTVSDPAVFAAIGVATVRYNALHLEWIYAHRGRSLGAHAYQDPISVERLREMPA
jgi:hypothetical protein